MLADVRRCCRGKLQQRLAMVPFYLKSGHNLAHCMSAFITAWSSSLRDGWTEILLYGMLLTESATLTLSVRHACILNSYCASGTE
jgi:hypothetical protein